MNIIKTMSKHSALILKIISLFVKFLIFKINHFWLVFLQYVNNWKYISVLLACRFSSVHVPQTKPVSESLLMKGISHTQPNSLQEFQTRKSNSLLCFPNKTPSLSHFSHEIWDIKISVNAVLLNGLMIVGSPQFHILSVWIHIFFHVSELLLDCDMNGHYISQIFIEIISVNEWVWTWNCVLWTKLFILKVTLSWKVNYWHFTDN